MSKSIVSVSRRKQRKAMFTADNNEKRVMMSSRLSKDLRSVWGFKAFPIHSQDVVIVKVGKFKGKEGRVENVSRTTRKVTIEGCTMPRSCGGVVSYPIDPSNLVIKQLFIDDCRTASLERKRAIYNKTKAKYAALEAENE